MIDLHTHTTASDGTCTPDELVARLGAAGVRAFSVTDHDTTRGLASVEDLASRAGLEFVPGIEITSVHEGHDVHVLGYAFDPTTPRLQAFLAEQASIRVARARTIGTKLARLGVAIDVDAVIADAARACGRTVGRPLLADALVREGHCQSRRDAFDRFLGSGGPAYVEREGASPSDVVALIVEAGGLPSLAHPGLLRVSVDIAELARRGLGAIEAYHSDHDVATCERFERVAGELGVGVSGGSDFHGEDVSRPRPLGIVSLPSHHYERLLAIARERGCARTPARRTGVA